ILASYRVAQYQRAKDEQIPRKHDPDTRYAKRVCSRGFEVLFRFHPLQRYRIYLRSCPQTSTQPAESITKELQQLSFSPARNRRKQSRENELSPKSRIRVHTAHGRRS